MSNPYAIPFPFRSFDPRRRVPLAKRLGGVSEYILSCLEQRKLETKATASLQYVTMVGRTHMLLLRESLVSLHRAWRFIPHLTILSDGSWQKAEFHNAFHFWPDPIEVLLPDDILVPLAKAGQSSLVKLAGHHPLGLKLVAILHLAQEKPVLFVDSDILWFSDPEKTLKDVENLPGPATTVEAGRSYNEEIIRRHCPEGISAPYVNSGCVYLKGKLCEEALLQAMLSTSLEQPDHPFNEQTIIAVAVQRAGRRLPSTFSLVDFQDAFALRMRRPWFEGFHSRHYVHWMRHQFYRDALRLRMQ